MASAAIAPAVEEARSYVRTQPTANQDETGWREGCKKAWLWVLATRDVSVFLVDLHGAEACGQRRSRASRDEDPGDEGGELAHHGKCDAEHHLGLRPENLERIDSLDRKHDADRGRQQCDDRHRQNADFHHLANHRIQSDRLMEAPAGDNPENTFADQDTPMTDRLDRLHYASTERLGMT